MKGDKHMMNLTVSSDKPLRKSVCSWFERWVRTTNTTKHIVMLKKYERKSSLCPLSAENKSVAEAPLIAKNLSAKSSFQLDGVGAHFTIFQAFESHMSMKWCSQRHWRTSLKLLVA